MINPPDDLLADLQSALPPEHQPATTTPPPSAGRRNQANGHDADMDDQLDHLYSRTSHELPSDMRTSESTVRGQSSEMRGMGQSHVTMSVVMVVVGCVNIVVSSIKSSLSSITVCGLTENTLV